MADDTVLVETGADGRATVTLNRPDVHNAFDDALIRRLDAALAEVARSGVRAVVLAGAGKSFSAGADLGWMRRMADYSRQENLADARLLAGLLHRLDAMPMPTIARVQGPAFGGGVGLAAACDVAIAAEGATFSLSEVRLGLIPAVISPYVVGAIGARHARRYMLTAERFGSAEALRIGLVHRAVAAPALDGAVDEAVAALRLGGPRAIEETKALVRQLASLADEGTRADTAARIARLRASPEGKEGVAAFLEKRKPGWRAP